MEMSESADNQSQDAAIPDNAVMEAEPLQEETETNCYESNSKSDNDEALPEESKGTECESIREDVCAQLSPPVNNVGDTQCSTESISKKETSKEKSPEVVHSDIFQEDSKIHNETTDTTDTQINEDVSADQNENPSVEQQDREQDALPDEPTNVQDALTEDHEVQTPLENSSTLLEQSNSETKSTDDQENSISAENEKEGDAEKSSEETISILNQSQLEKEDDVTRGYTSESENLEDSTNENPVFVHVNTETEKNDSSKDAIDSDRQVSPSGSWCVRIWGSSRDAAPIPTFASSNPYAPTAADVDIPVADRLKRIQEEDDDFQSAQPQEDPIASDDFIPTQMEEDNDEAEQPCDEEQGASEELCIIPDTERIISQEEKDAVACMLPLREPVVANAEEFVLKDVAADVVEKYIISVCTAENVNTCMQCCLTRKSKYSVGGKEKMTFICDDNCLNLFKDKYGTKVIVNSEGDLRVKNLSSGLDKDNMVAKVNFCRKCMECDKGVVNDEFNLSWETMEFCNEFCLSKYQKRIGSNCANCQSEVRSNCLGKYCVRFGYDIRQFCSSVCLEEYKKGLKVCSFCQKDMSGGGDGFLAPVGDRGQFKDFCTQQCMEKYDIMSNNREQPITKTGSICSVCLNEKPITIEFEHDKKMNLFCGEPCFVAFKFVNNITPGKCDMCKKYFDNKVLEDYSMYYDNAQHSFCSKSCQNIYIIAHRKIVPCSWCKVKKYNFDMIKRNNCSGPALMMCSLNCLSLYQVSMNAVNSKKIRCDQCHKNLQPLYHLTMSDATIRNFCSYSCVMTFQNQFPKTPITLNEPDESAVPVPTGAPKRSKKLSAKNVETFMPADVPTIPVISSVQSLATANGTTPTNTRSTRANSGTDSSIVNANSVPTLIKTQIKQHVIFKPPPYVPQRNVATMCKTATVNKGINHKPTVVSREVQTDELKDRTAIIPIPVPIYVPAPLWMFSMPFPVPFPFPLPVPVPVFIPTTRNSASGIMKEIKKIQVKIPTDPFEAELLMMAEMVAGDKREEHTDSESEEEDTTAAAEEGTFSPEPVDASNTFGDDMLQMALKMATELDEPAVDLEGALTASTITASQGGETTGNDESVDDPQPIHHMMERQVVRGRKRPGRPPRSASSKRGRRASNQMEMSMMAPPQPPPPPEPAEKPDANMCLKYTFGVNAWKQWVTTKNAELEKTSRRVKLFKPEILQLTADELNYSLCLFVKEVRKPNGQEYAPDTIYYLCLGIQQYLFENGRIDNIFCDSYYEKFTDCLDEVAKKFSVLYNDSHYIVTRVEEEHLWESKQLGAHSPHVLLSTLMFFNTKHFNLTTVDEHMQLSFSHIMKHWKRNPNQPGTNKIAGSRNVLLRFYPPQTTSDSSTRKKKVYEQQENEDNPLRCPVKLYEFYLSKCPESVKTRNDVFYLLPERSCVPDSPVWYSTMPLPRNALEKMLHRVKMVKEINVALLTS